MKHGYHGDDGTKGRTACGVKLLAGLGLVLSGQPTQAGEDLGAALNQGRPIADIRLRYERVDQSGLARKAEALTLRTRLGFETGAFHDLTALIEAEITAGLGPENYNDTINGRTAFPVVADPESTELNRAQLTYSGITDTKITAGRQRIILDNARFVGNVGWRQNEQTFDAVLASTQWIPDIALTYAYVGQVHRIFGSDSPVGEFDSDSHLLNATFTGLPLVDITGYGYWLDLDEAPAASTTTYGLRAAASSPSVSGVAFHLTGDYAHQSDYANNPRTVSLDYYLAEASATYTGVTGLAGYEVLEGDGAVGFSTPLATLHAFQGWADVFLTTPASGIEDFYLKAAYVTSEVPLVTKLTTALIYHDFSAEQTSASLGSEWDAVIATQLDEHVALTAKYASYDGPFGGPADRDKFWLEINFKL